MDYEKHKIAALIDKFWQGESSLKEEKVLEEYFLYSEHVPAEFADAEQYFRVRRERSHNAVLPADFESNLLNKIEESESPGKGRLVSLTFAWKAAAAMIILALTAGLWFQLQDDSSGQLAGTKSAAQDTYEDPREAFEATKEALFMMSSKFNEGSSEVMKIKKFDQAQNKIKTTEK